MKIAVLHGNYFQRGGGEHVADHIAKTYNAPLYYGFGNPDEHPDDNIQRKQLFNPNKLSRYLAHNLHQYRDSLFMWYGQHLPELHDYDVIIQSGNEFGWYVPKDNQTIIKYVHSPPRSSYDLFHREGGSPLHRAYATTVRTLYRPTTTFPDRYVANSELVANRCRKYWGKDATVLYPPVDTDKYSKDRKKTDPTLYLTYNRLFRHKRTREIVEAFADHPDKELIVGGKGPELDTIREIAPENVTIRGYLGEEEKRDLLSQATGLVYNPVNEDFGIIPIEAFASGTPVIGVRDGFTQCQIKNGINGVLFDDHSVSSVFHGVREYEQRGVGMSENQLMGFAEQFNTDRFERELDRILCKAVSNDSACKMWAGYERETTGVR